MKLRKVIIAIGVILLVFLSNAGSVMAEREIGTYTLTPFIGGYLFDSDLDLDNKPLGVLGAGFGFTLDKTWDIEGVFKYIDTESEAGAGDVKGYQYHLDGLYHFMPSGKLLPYLAAGIGGITLDPDRGGSDTDPLINYGAGVKYFLKENMALRGDVRHIISFGSTNHNLCYTIGLSIFFGGEKKKIVKPPADIDKDGVYDYLDKCPDTPAGVKVNTKGCPLDSDEDGVYDYQDQCPDTPKGVSVDSQGCPLDTDKDGVYDYLDKCPDTPRGATVNHRGCWVLTGVLFETARWDIKPQAYSRLNEIVDILKKNPSLRLEIQGHTDTQGSERLNKRLSENRAQAVMEYLVKQGIEPRRLRAVGLWFTQPAASNDTPEGRAQNRRVELKPVY